MAIPWLNQDVSAITASIAVTSSASVRLTLTTEAALNDGLAFPFVYLGLVIAAKGLALGSWGPQWLMIDVLYRISAGVAMGAAGGWALGKVLFANPRGAVLAETASGVVALAGVLLCYGSTELVEGYGFIAVAAMGLVLRRIENENRFHRRLHDFCETIEHALTALLLVALGSVLPALFCRSHLDACRHRGAARRLYPPGGSMAVAAWHRP